jgi:hypothetical protein
MVFSHIVFLFYFFIFQNHICQFYFFYIKLIENLVLQFLFFKTLLIATVFLRMVFFCFCFFMIFSEIILFYFIFLILSWLKITVAICEKNTVTFLTNYYGLLQCFFQHGFFCFVMFFLQIVFFNLIF